ncbi:SDR family NAD(P)-dependent oxidoreductase [Paraburkholderia oxyphila]|uniref:SDR family NAD(P)-dependent oxidoreductase n=1 Tax=Paraburkholderia oxyphila TaxID=614212 RepID=UPI0004811E22|nr:SDR family NAD(P)-dependent oxidoreductase [Paraburkholderia oxyphila]
MSESRLLDGKVAVISGAASPRGIGMATARMFAKHGARIAIFDLDLSAARDAAASIGPEHRGYVCDVTSREACEAAAQQVVADFGAIDVLINNAGITQAARLLDIDSASWDRVLDVNLRGVLNLSQAVVPQMKKQQGGAIACMSSVSAQRGGGILGGPHYSAAKAGVLGLAKAMARELGNDGIRVNCVTPGLIQTDINAGKISDDKRGEILAGIPLNRLGVPDDVAGAFLFLSAPISSYITGAVIDVNGGMLIHG